MEPNDDEPAGARPSGGLVGRYRAAYAGMPREVWLCAAGLLINRAGTMVVPFLSLYLTTQRGMGKGAVGLLLAGFGVGSILGSLLGGFLSTRVGATTVQRLSLAGTGALLLALPEMGSTGAIAACVFALAVVGDAYRPAVMTALAEYGAPRSARAIALGRLAINLGLTIGPAIGGFLAERSYRGLFVVDAVTCFAAAAFLTFALRGDPRGRRPSAAPRRGVSPWADPRMRRFLVACFVLAITFFQIGSTLPVYLTEAYGLPERAFGLLMGLNCAMIVLFEMPLVHALERTPPLRVMAVGALLVGGGMGVMPFGHGAAYAALTVVVWTIGEMTAVPASNAYVTRLAGDGRLGQAMGMFSATFGVAQVVAPSAGLAVYARFGGDAVWYGVLVLGTLGAALCAWMDRADRGGSEDPRDRSPGAPGDPPKEVSAGAARSARDSDG